MPVIIEDHAHQRFFGGREAWVSNPHQALRFDSFVEAADYAQEHQVQGGRVLTYATQRPAMPGQRQQSNPERKQAAAARK